MPRHKKDTLVTLEPSALDPRGEWYDYNQRAVRNHGYLWLVGRWNYEHDYYECRSLATGRRFNFRSYEITTSKRVMEQADGTDT